MGPCVVLVRAGALCTRPRIIVDVFCVRLRVCACVCLGFGCCSAAGRAPEVCAALSVADDPPVGVPLPFLPSRKGTTLQFVAADAVLLPGTGPLGNGDVVEFKVGEGGGCMRVRVPALVPTPGRSSVLCGTAPCAVFRRASLLCSACYARSCACPLLPPPPPPRLEHTGHRSPWTAALAGGAPRACT